MCVYINAETGLYLKTMCTEIFQKVFLIAVLYTTVSIKENSVHVCRQLFFCLPTFINTYKRDVNELSIKTNQFNTNLSWLQDVVSLLFSLAF